MKEWGEDESITVISDAERRLKLLVEDALEDAPIPPTPTPSTYEEHDEDSQTQLVCFAQTI